MTDSARCANVLGALALVITDQSAAAMAAGTDLSASAASAVSALAEFLDQPTLDELRKVVGLTPSGVVRLVDRLADAGLVSRGAGSDGRSRAIILTERGRAVAGELRIARLASLQGMLTGLTDDEQETLHTLLGRVMGTIVEQKSGGAWICRQCDLAACERAAGHCPAQVAAKKKYNLS
ncbi:MAG: MarR family transcriptional regulator [Nakamurella sp.]